MRFWFDSWCGDPLLKESFPVLFGISSCYDAKVADFWESESNHIIWFLCFGRNFQERVGIGACYSSVHSACGSEGGCADRLG